MMNSPKRGDRFSRLTYISSTTKKSPNGNRLGLWRCDCGIEKEISTTRVTHGDVHSCGCLKLEIKPGLKHGMKKSSTYRSWQAMKARCESETNKDYYRYGAVGIRVHQSWLSFENFLRDMGTRPEGTTLDRIDGTRGYEPGNCRWATSVQQARNTKSFTVVSTPRGVMPLIDYSKILGISNGAAHLRLKRGKLEGCKKICA